MTGIHPRVLIISGPNLNLLGEREPDIYGTATLEEHIAAARVAAEEHGIFLDHLQSNHEGQLIDAVHEARRHCQAIIVNAGALTHYAWALADALSAFDGPVVELHLSNPQAREPWRRLSVFAGVAHGSIAGFGQAGYVLAVEAVAQMLENKDGAAGQLSPGEQERQDGL